MHEQQPTEHREFGPRMNHESLFPRIRCGDPNRAMGTLILSTGCQQPLWELHLGLPELVAVPAYHAIFQMKVATKDNINGPGPE